MNAVLERIHEIGILPVIALDDAEKAVPLAKALLAGGLPAAEVTFRTAAAEESIRRISREVPGVLVGAGTVTTTEQADRAIAAGAKFLVSPGFNPEVVKYAISKGVPITPGTATAGEMEQAMALGLDVVKFFPAEQLGGVAMLKALAGPYRNLKWIPTGGVNAKNLMDYLSFDRILAVGGTWMVKKDLIAEGRFDEIERLTREAVNTMLGFGLHHIGINHENEAEAMAMAGLLQNLFGFAPRDNGTMSVFSSDGFELMKLNGKGRLGHICIGTNDVDRAMAHLALRGARFVEESKKFDAAGHCTFVYLEGDFSGFAIHLKKK